MDDEVMMPVALDEANNHVGSYVVRSQIIDQIVKNGLINEVSYRFRIGKTEDNYEAQIELILERIEELTRKNLIVHTSTETEDGQIIEDVKLNPSYEDVSIMTAFYVIYKQYCDYGKVFCTTKDIIRIVKKNLNYNPGKQEYQHFNDRIRALWSSYIKCLVEKRDEFTIYKEGHMVELTRLTAEDEAGNCFAEEWEILSPPLLIECCEEQKHKSYLSSEYFILPSNHPRITSDILVMQERIGIRIDQYINAGKFSNEHIPFYKERNRQQIGLMAWCGFYKDDYSNSSSWARKKSTFKSNAIMIFEGYLEQEILPYYYLAGKKLHPYKVCLGTKVDDKILAKADEIILPKKPEIYGLDFWKKQKIRKRSHNHKGVSDKSNNSNQKTSKCA